jgi:beta-glucosidase
VRSDGGALWETAAPALGGCDQEMPSTVFYGVAALGAAIQNGSVSEARVREMVTRQLTAYFALNVLSDPLAITADAPVSSVARVQLAREVAVAATVLLKNDPARRVLPVDSTALRSIVVFGDELSTEGGGSGHVVAQYTVTPTQGIYTAVNGGLAPPPTQRPNNSCALEVGVDYDNGGVCLDGIASVADCCNVCTADSTCVSFTFHANASCSGGGGGSRCWKHTSLASKRTLPGVTSGVCPPNPPLPPGPSGVAVTYGGADPATAPALAAAADLAVVVVATTSSEGSDRPTLSLDAPFDALAAAVLAAQPNTVVVVRCPGPCLMPWLADAPAVFFQGMAGQEAGSALADVLFGLANPAGRLVNSFPASETDTWIQSEVQYPGTVRDGAPCCFPQTDFSEKLEMGYRWYDAQGVKPLFEFGFGLSYTSFTYSGLSAQVVSPSPNASVVVSLTVTNTGSVAGAEVAQLYVGYPAAAGEPPQLLRAFKRTWVLAPGEAAQIEWSLPARAFSIFDLPSDDWAVVPGTYELRAGASSRDIRLTTSVSL